MCNNRVVFVFEFRMPCDVEFRHSDVRTSFGANGDTRGIRVFDVTTRFGANGDTREIRVLRSTSSLTSDDVTLKLESCM
jgi:hypothetical protein